MAREYRYGDAGDHYPVERGDIWKVGPHTVVCGDIEANDHLQVMELDGPISMAYMDPPWDQGNATLFRRKAAQERGEKFERFLGRIVEGLRPVQGDIYLEMGNRSLPLLTRLLTDNGAAVLDVWPIYYYRTKPCNLIRASYHHSKVITGSPKGMDDDDTPDWAVDASTEPGDLVLDLCVGQGGTAKAAAILGRRFLGMDLNPRRLAVTIDSLVKLGQGTASKVGVLT